MEETSVLDKLKLQNELNDVNEQISVLDNKVKLKTQKIADDISEIISISTVKYESLNISENNIFFHFFIRCFTKKNALLLLIISKTIL